MLMTQRLPANAGAAVNFTLALTAEERTRSRHRFEIEDEYVFLRLPRGTVLRDGDILRSQVGDILVRVSAKPEPVLTVTAKSSLDLLRAAYHLGNRHIPLEIAASYLRLSPDSVLHKMLEQMGMEVEEAILPFQPETGAYGDNHVH